MSFVTCYRQLIERQDLSEEAVAALFDEMFSGQLHDAQIGAFLGAMSTKGETVAELAGAARAMRAKAHRIQVMGQPVVDTCGTGGDGADTFNISTATAFVVAGAGIKVAKHGNRSVSSACGSADVLEALGLQLDIDPELVEEQVNEIGIGFMFAPRFHGAMKHVMPARKALGTRSIFNMLGPLTNPAAASCQLLGVFAPQLTEMFAGALKLLGTSRAFVVHGHDGLDEISVCAATRVSELKNGQIRTYDIQPERYFGELADPADLRGGDVAENTRILRGIFDGSIQGASRNVVLINAGAALVSAGQVDELGAGIHRAASVIDEGKAIEKLEALIEYR
jgi:anthranilate phosphoribosyltransferase